MSRIKVEELDSEIYITDNYNGYSAHVPKDKLDNYIYMLRNELDDYKSNHSDLYCGENFCSTSIVSRYDLGRDFRCNWIRYHRIDKILDTIEEFKNRNKVLDKKEGESCKEYIKRLYGYKVFNKTNILKRLNKTSTLKMLKISKQVQRKEGTK